MGISAADAPRVLKCVLVGDAAAGKTSLIVSYTTNSWNPHYVPTAFDNYSVLVQVDHKPIRLELSDTAGQSEFDSLRPFSYPDSDVFLLCFNVMRPASLRSIANHWIPEISRSSPNAPVILVGTHSDLRTNMDELMKLSRAGERPVSESKGRMLAEELNSDYIECSALTQHNLKEVFDRAIIVALGGKSQTPAPKAEKKSSFTEGFRRLLSMTKKKFI
uniref:Rho-related GTP-binding protein RhoU n=1 Tax=Steinernema glaseri TaxID=37863 RepID=A0A1I7ZHY5_9BILA